MGRLKRLLRHRRYTDVNIQIKYGSQTENTKIPDHNEQPLSSQCSEETSSTIRKPTPSKLHDIEFIPRNPIFRGTGSNVLRQFISTLGPRAEASLSRGLVRKGTGIQAPNSWTYEAQTGYSNDLEHVRRLICSRAARVGGRLHAGGWSRLLLGDDFAQGKARKQTHLLKLRSTSCSCIWCQTAEVGGDMDEMLAEITMDMETDIENAECCETSTDKSSLDLLTACTRAEIRDMVTTQDMAILGQIAEGELELGVVDRIDRGGRVKFSEMVDSMINGNQYSGRMSRQEIEKKVVDCARQHYKKRGKNQRKFYVRGQLCRFILEGPGVIVFPSTKPKGTDISHSVGVVYRKQAMSVFVGHLAMEDAFGSFYDVSDSPFYIGFGDDSAGAQSIMRDGGLDHARYVGINELRSHLALRRGEEFIAQLQ